MDALKAGIANAMQERRTRYNPVHPYWVDAPPEKTKNEILAWKWTIGGGNQGHIAVQERWLESYGWQPAGFRVKIQYPDGSIEGIGANNVFEAAEEVAKAMQVIAE